MAQNISITVSITIVLVFGLKQIVVVKSCFIFMVRSRRVGRGHGEREVPSGGRSGGPERMVGLRQSFESLRPNERGERGRLQESFLRGGGSKAFIQCSERHVCRHTLRPNERAFHEADGRSEIYVAVEGRGEEGPPTAPRSCVFPGVPEYAGGGAAVFRKLFSGFTVVQAIL